MVRRACAWIYRLLRWLVFHFWRELTDGEMLAIAENYGFDVVRASDLGRHSLLGIPIIGSCDYNQKVLWISKEHPRVFWHELGHRVNGPSAEGLIGWFVGEVIATLQGYRLNWKWRRFRLGM